MIAIDVSVIYVVKAYGSFTVTSSGGSMDSGSFLYTTGSSLG